ncbi:MAG: phospholipase A [Proteobacteria bacterium]|nr:phospholipase A [Pseudomonadota bacterium]MBU1739570.1 phospholipase A [Pseudomonadota bacterium]
MILVASLVVGISPAGCAESGESGNEPEYEYLDSLYQLYQPYLPNISAYEPIYFLVGVKPEKSKFQFSFKYRFFSRAGSLAGNHPWVQGFHFGYTQTSFWNLEANSLPFEDTSYKPELFHLTRNVTSRPAWLQGLFFQSGILHESNGQAGELSRSTNILYLRTVFVLFRANAKLGLGVAPKVWVYVDNSENNSDLGDYRGNFELNFIMGKADSLVLSSGFRLARAGGSVQVDLSYPVGNHVEDNLNIYLHAQYANALAESLIEYRDRTEALRIGISFVR